MAVLGTVRSCLQDGNAYKAYRDAKENNGAPGIDGVTFEAIEKAGLEDFLKQIQNELVSEHISSHAEPKTRRYPRALIKSGF